MRKIFIAIIVLFSTLSAAHAQPAAGSTPDVNLALMANKAIPTSSDSIDNSYSYLAGNFADDKSETAWITGFDMSEHWANLQWRNVSVSVNRIEMDFSPVTFVYNPPKMFGETQTPSSRNVTTVKPQSLQLEVHTGGAWKTIHKFSDPLVWQENKIILPLSPALSQVKEVRLKLKTEKPDEAIAVREIKIWGPKTPSSFSFRPKWRGYWMWGELEPQMANYGLVKRYFRRVFEIKNADEIRSAKFLFVAHDRGAAWLNGSEIARTAHTGAGMNREIARRDVNIKLLKTGKNLLALQGEDVDEVGLRGVLCELWIEKKDGTFEVIASTPGDFSVNSFDEPNWNSALSGFEDWAKARGLNTPNSEIAWGWSFDYTPPYFAGAVQIADVKLEPKIPRAGETFNLAFAVHVKKPLDDDYGVIVDYGDIGNARPSYMDFSRGEGFVRPENALPKGFVGEKTISISDVWTGGATPRMPIFIRVANAKNQLGVLPAATGEVTSGEQPGRLKIYVGAPPIQYAKSGFPNVKTSGGRLSIDGVLTAPIVFTASLQTPERYVENLKSGVNIFRIMPQGVSSVVPDDGQEGAHFARMLETVKTQVEAIHSVNPNAKFLLALELDMPNDWKFEHPEDVIVLGDDTRLQPLSSTNHSIGYIQETPNSPAVLKKVRAALREFTTRLSKQPYAHSILGYSLMHGRAGENYWGIDSNMSQDEDGNWIIPPRSQYFWGDFGVSARRSFRDWLKAKYQTKENLALAWKVPGMDFEDVVSSFKWPNAKFVQNLMWRGRPANRFMFRDQTSEGALFRDFTQHQNEARAQLFIEAGKAVKAASGGKLLSGGYIGYVVPSLTNSPPAHAQHSGHLAWKMLMDSPYIDYLFSPHFYHMRRAGDPVMPMSLPDSLRLHGKLWMNEYDSRTYLSPISPKTFSQTETREQFQKEFGNAITRDQGWWWLEFNFNTVGAQAASWFADETLQRDAGVMKTVYQTELKNAPQSTPSAEIAVIVNAEQPFYTDAYSPANTVHSNVANFLIPRLSQLGAPFDLYAQSDLPVLKERGWLQNYKLVLFVNAFHLDAAEREIINTDLKRDGKTLLFFFAPGYQGNADPKTELALSGIEDVTGMKGIRKLDEQHVLGLTLNDNALVKNLSPRDFDAIGWWGKEQIDNYGNPIGPTFYLDAGQANNWTPLATLRLDEKNDASKVALAQLKTPNFTSIYSVLPDLPTEVLSAIAVQSGAHIYSRPGILTWANRDFLCVSTGRAAKQIKLTARENVTWIEPFEKKIYAKNMSTLTIDLAAGETKFFCLEKKGEWQNVLSATAP
jgi:hypothetical protein